MSDIELSQDETDRLVSKIKDYFSGELGNL